jgi:hypothetical protein
MQKIQQAKRVELRNINGIYEKNTNSHAVAHQDCSP